MHTAGADETGGERGATGEQLEPARPGGGGATSNGDERNGRASTEQQRAGVLCAGWLRSRGRETRLVVRLVGRDHGTGATTCMHGIFA